MLVDMTTRSEMIAVRVDPELRARIRRHQEAIQAGAPGLRITEADAIRDLIFKGLEKSAGLTKRRRG